jgi:hypothetical protein
MKQNLPSSLTTLKNRIGHVHIDRLTVSGPLDHKPIGEPLYKAFPGSDESVYCVGTEAVRPNKRKKREQDDIFIKSHTVGQDDRTYRVRFDCCPPQVLQGHNVFGHNGVRDYCYEIFQQQTRKYERPPTPEDEEYWRTGQVEVSHLHLTGNLWCPPDYKMMIFDAIDANNRSGKHRDSDTYIRLGLLRSGSHSPFHTATIYDKFCLLAHGWRFPGPLQTELLEIAEHSIRLEFKLYSQWLRTHGVDLHGNIVNLIELRKKDPEAAKAFKRLHWASSWDYVDLDRLFFQLVGKYDIRNAIQPLLTEDELKMLTKAQRRAYIHWLNGEHLEDHYGRTARHTLACGIYEATQIDINAHRRPEKLPQIHLADVFCSENLVAVPDGLLGTERYWQPLVQRPVVAG